MHYFFYTIWKYFVYCCSDWPSYNKQYTFFQRSSFLYGWCSFLPLQVVPDWFISWTKIILMFSMRMNIYGQNNTQKKIRSSWIQGIPPTEKNIHKKMWLDRTVNIWVTSGSQEDSNFVRYCERTAGGGRSDLYHGKCLFILLFALEFIVLLLNNSCFFKPSTGLLNIYSFSMWKILIHMAIVHVILIIIRRSQFYLV